MTWYVAIDDEFGPYISEESPDSEDELILETDIQSEAEQALCRQCNLWESDEFQEGNEDDNDSTEDT